MSLLNRIRGALGWRPPLAVQSELPPLAIGDGARERLAQLAAGMGVHIETRPAHRGRVVVVTEGEAQGPPPPAFGDLPVTISDQDLARLGGRTLDHEDGRWLVRVHLDVRAQDTPNPDSRVYLFDRALADGRPAFFSADAAEPPDLAARILEAQGVRTVLFRENTITIERDPAAAWPAVDVAVDAAVREHLLACGALVAGGAVDRSGDPLFERIRAALAEQVAPAIHRDGGDIELVDFRDGVVLVSMVGACRTCPSSTATLRHGIERTLQELFPGQVLRVEQV